MTAKKHGYDSRLKRESASSCWQVSYRHVGLAASLGRHLPGCLPRQPRYDLHPVNRDSEGFQAPSSWPCKTCITQPKHHTCNISHAAPTQPHLRQELGAKVRHRIQLCVPARLQPLRQRDHALVSRQVVKVKDL